jgi:glycosyltransferase involved in cell wall biosynthesis
MSDAPVREPIATAPLSVVLLAYETGPDLAAILNEWVAVLERRGVEYEILLVHDGGAEPAPVIPLVRVLRHESRQGLGAALRTGIAAARHRLFFYTTADRQYHPDDLKLMLDQIDQVDMVSGYRSWQPVPAWLRGVGFMWRAFLRVVMGVTEEKKPCWLGWPEERKRWLARLLFGLRVQDVNCAYRLFRREVLERFPIQSDGAFAQTELLAKANFLAWMSEVAVRYTPPKSESVPYYSEWNQSEIMRLFAHPEFRPPAAPKDTFPPRPESGPGPSPSDVQTPIVMPPITEG